MEPVPAPAPPQTTPRSRIWTARGLAAAADALQIGLFPLFGEGFASPADLILDGVMAIALTRLVGFHWSYLPTTAIELIPGADLAPTWTAAALLATSGTSSVLRKAMLLAGAGLLLTIALCIWLWRR